MRQINPYPVALGWHAHTHAHAQGKNLPLRGQRFFGRKNTNFQLKTQDGKTHSNKVNAGKGVWKTLRKGQGKETHREKDKERERDTQYRQYPKTVQHRHHHHHRRHHHHHLQSARPDRTRAGLTIIRQIPPRVVLPHSIALPLSVSNETRTRLDADRRKYTNQIKYPQILLENKKTSDKKRRKKVL